MKQRCIGMVTSELIAFLFWDTIFKLYPHNLRTTTLMNTSRFSSQRCLSYIKKKYKYCQLSLKKLYRSPPPSTSPFFTNKFLTYWLNVSFSLHPDLADLDPIIIWFSIHNHFPSRSLLPCSSTSVIFFLQIILTWQKSVSPLLHLDLACSWFNNSMNPTFTFHNWLPLLRWSPPRSSSSSAPRPGWWCSTCSWTG